MKKSLLFTAIVISAIWLTGCSGSKKTDNSDSSTATSKSEIKASLKERPNTPAAGMVAKTLDGVDSLEAIKDINYFQTHSSTGPAETIRTFLLKSDMLKKIATLLVEEKKAQTNAHWAHTVDGVRIYLAMDHNNPNSPVSLMFVTTLDSAKVNGKPAHHDYYSHSKSAALYLNPPPPVTAEQNPTAATGALLYGTCTAGCAIDPTCTAANTHITERKFAENMVQARKGPHAPSPHPFNMKAEWFDLDIIVKLASDTNLDALRFYFGTHPAIDPTPAYNSKDAFVITTTHFDATNYVDYYDCKTLQALLKLPGARFGNTPPLDKGALCPDNCNIDSEEKVLPLHRHK